MKCMPNFRSAGFFFLGHHVLRRGRNLGLREPVDFNRDFQGVPVPFLAVEINESELTVVGSPFSTLNLYLVEDVGFLKASSVFFKMPSSRLKLSKTPAAAFM